jgi:hypothetical protein
MPAPPKVSFQPLPAGSSGSSKHPNTIRRNASRQKLLPLDAEYERARARYRNRISYRLRTLKKTSKWVGFSSAEQRTAEEEIRAEERTRLVVDQEAVLAAWKTANPDWKQEEEGGSRNADSGEGQKNQPKSQIDSEGEDSTLPIAYEEEEEEEEEEQLPAMISPSRCRRVVLSSGSEGEVSRPATPDLSESVDDEGFLLNSKEIADMKDDLDLDESEEDEEEEVENPDAVTVVERKATYQGWRKAEAWSKDYIQNWEARAQEAERIRQARLATRRLASQQDRGTP